jgi:hypothetical protein
MPTSSSCSPVTTRGLREHTLWRMLYETTTRSAEVLALNVEDLDLPIPTCANYAPEAGHGDSRVQSARPDRLGPW